MRPPSRPAVWIAIAPSTTALSQSRPVSHSLDIRYPLHVRLVAVPSIATIAPDAWDRLGDPDYPFMEHAFLLALETSGSVGQGSGWHPIYLLATNDYELTADRSATELPADAVIHGAAAAYIKTDSYGEFIFDWAWASFFHRNGESYYPKLVVAAPFTPAAGPRVLVHPNADPVEVTRLLGSGAVTLTKDVKATSVHWLFTREEEAQALARLGYEHRLTVQHAWQNNGYATFDEFLATMRSRNRKQIRRERRLASSHGLHIGIYRGSEMDDEQWRAIGEFYLRGCHRYGSTPYLTAAFFEQLRAHFADRVLCCMARDDERWVAATINFQRGKHLYGRYWGCVREYYALHFEMAFYKLIEHCIENGWTRFEAGAGGRHKIKRGLEPVFTHSAHWIADKVLGAAVYHHIRSESEYMTQHLQDVKSGSTRRRDVPGPVLDEQSDPSL